MIEGILGLRRDRQSYLHQGLSQPVHSHCTWMSHNCTWTFPMHTDLLDTCDQVHTHWSCDFLSVYIVRFLWELSSLSLNIILDTLLIEILLLTDPVTEGCWPQVCLGCWSDLWGEPGLYKDLVLQIGPFLLNLTTKKTHLPLLFSVGVALLVPQHMGYHTYSSLNWHVWGIVGKVQGMW